MNNDFTLIGVYDSIVDFSVAYLSGIGLSIFPQNYANIGANIVNNGFYKVIYTEKMLYFYKQGYYDIFESREDFIEAFISRNGISANNNSLPFTQIAELMEDRELFYFSHNIEDSNQILVTDTCIKQDLIDLKFDCCNN